MRPAKVRDLLAPYGEVGRIYLKPEGILCATCCTASHRFLDVALCRFRTASHDRAHALLLSRTVCVCLCPQINRLPIGVRRGAATKRRSTPRVGSSLRTRRWPSRYALSLVLDRSLPTPNDAGVLFSVCRLLRHSTQHRLVRSPFSAQASTHHRLQ
jgi:hypothetical protein